MDKIDNFNEVKLYLKQKEIITSNGSDSFYYRDDYVIHKFNGNTVKIKFADFIDLYKDKEFYLKPDEQDTVDLKKDEEYYGRIQKRN